MMKSLLVSVIFILTTSVTTLVVSKDYKEARNNLKNPSQAVIDLNKSAKQTARALGIKGSAGSISCDASMIHCTCDGAIDCAWLALACSSSGGVQGFEGECFFPSAVPSAQSAINNFKNQVGGGNATADGPCQGLFCTCKAPKNSSDCNTIKAKCADEFLCIRDECSCLNGSTD